MDHIRFDAAQSALLLLDQRLLPGREEIFACRSVEDVIAAVKTMVVRGAPAIGIAAAFGCVLAAYSVNGAQWREKLAQKLSALRAARPTAVNLAWAMDRMESAAQNIDTLEELRRVWLDAALAMQAEDVAICRRIGANGADLIKDGDVILTHCNAGALATAGYGTALGVIRAAHAQGKKIRVIADETRPLWQGARLTAWELARDGIPVQIACDNACACLLGQGRAQLVITGADRIAANGDSANKIGTLGVAIIAAWFNVPFYIAAPLSTIDMRAADGSDIPIEARAEAEVLEPYGMRIAPEEAGAYNFAFDVTPARLIRGIITEAGVLRAPYGESIGRALSAQGSHA